MHVVTNGAGKMERWAPDDTGGAIGVYPGFSIMEYRWGGVTRTLAISNSGFTLTTTVDGVKTTHDLLTVFDRLDALEARVAALEA